MKRKNIRKFLKELDAKGMIAPPFNVESAVDELEGSRKKHLVHNIVELGYITYDDSRKISSWDITKGKVVFHKPSNLAIMMSINSPGVDLASLRNMKIDFSGVTPLSSDEIVKNLNDELEPKKDENVGGELCRNCDEPKFACPRLDKNGSEDEEESFGMAILPLMKFSLFKHLPELFDGNLPTDGISSSLDDGYSVQWGEFIIFAHAGSICEIHRPILPGRFSILLVGDGGKVIHYGKIESSNSPPIISRVILPSSKLEPGSRAFWVVVGKLSEPI